MGRLPTHQLPDWLDKNGWRKKRVLLLMYVGVNVVWVQYKYGQILLSNVSNKDTLSFVVDNFERDILY